MNARSQRDPQTFAVIGSAIEVHKELGHGFLEAVYHEALAAEFHLRSIPFQREAPIRIRYKGGTLPIPYRADFLCYEDLLVEIKALAEIAPIQEAQLLHYLKASGIRRGLLINFGAPSLEFKRLVWGH